MNADTTKMDTKSCKILGECRPTLLRATSAPSTSLTLDSTGLPFMSSSVVNCESEAGTGHNIGFGKKKTRHGSMSTTTSQMWPLQSNCDSVLGSSSYSSSKDIYIRQLSDNKPNIGKALREWEWRIDEEYDEEQSAAIMGMFAHMVNCERGFSSRSDKGQFCMDTKTDSTGQLKLEAIVGFKLYCAYESEVSAGAKRKRL
jgi:hypothetical protein